MTKDERNPKPECRRALWPAVAHSSFGFRYSFGFRHSSFGFEHCRLFRELPAHRSAGKRRGMHIDVEAIRMLDDFLDQGAIHFHAPMRKSICVRMGQRDDHRAGFPDRPSMDM